MKNVLLRALIHERVAPAMHGRAFAAYNAARNAAELAALFAGATLVAMLGPRETLVVAGAGSAAIGLAALVVLATRATTQPALVPVPHPPTGKLAAQDTR